MLEIKKASLKAGEFSVKGINLTIKDSSCHIIIGPTGAGKSVVLEGIMGFKKLISGEIWLDGKNITNLPPEQRGISYLPQDLALFPHLNVKENILYGLKIKGIEDRKYLDFIEDLIETLEIRRLLNRGVHNLSGGERQRVALVRALAPGNKYLLLDEPFSALHEGMKRELWFLLKKLQKRYGLTILMVSHDVEEAFFLGDTISIMINGKFEQIGEKEEVYRRPKTLRVARFFGIKNLFETKVMDIGDETLDLYCAELNTKLTVLKEALSSRNIKRGDRLIAGIRAEEVMILRKDFMRKDQENLLKGTIKEIFPKGHSYTVIFEPESVKRYIEIEVPAYAFQKLSLREGQNTNITFRKERIFLIPDRGLTV